MNLVQIFNWSNIVFIMTTFILIEFLYFLYRAFTYTPSLTYKPLMEIASKRREESQKFQTKVHSLLGSKELNENMDPFVCADYLRHLIQLNYLPSELVTTNLHEFYASHRGFVPKMGALGIRFTVQFNLFLGSITALASEKQKKTITARHSQGELGCFALTEKGAGTLSGLVVETTCTWIENEQKFILHSPTDTSKKIWISQGMVASMGVVIAQLIVKEKCIGVHAFLIEMESEGVIRTNMGRKLNFNALDNALLSFHHVRLPPEALLSKFCNIKNDCYQAKKNFKFLLIAQRLLTGRVAIPMAMIGTLDSTIRSCKQFFANRRIFISRNKEDYLGNLPYLRNRLDRIEAIYNIMEAFLSIVENISPNRATTREIDLIAVAKIHCVGFSCRCSTELRFMTGSYALTNDFFSRGDIYLCGKFAEGDSKILQQKMVRDLLTSQNVAALLFKIIFLFPLYILNLLPVTEKLLFSRNLELIYLYLTFFGLSREDMFSRWYEKCDIVFQCASKHGLYVIYQEILSNYGYSSDLYHFSTAIQENDILLSNC